MAAPKKQDDSFNDKEAERNEVKTEDNTNVPPNDQGVRVIPLIDAKLFENVQSGDHCHGKGHCTECKAMKRVMAALDYYGVLVLGAKAKKMVVDPKAVFMEFVDEIYPKKIFLNDYIHWVLYHNTPEEAKAIRSALQHLCDSAKDCGATTRHYRDRRQDGNGVEDAPNEFMEKLDSIHFNIFHLQELGLRVSSEMLENEMKLNGKEMDESQLFDLGLKRMAQVIEAKRSAFSNERLDGIKNVKFNLQINEQSIDGIHAGSDGKVKDTKRDFLSTQMWKRLPDVDAFKTLNRFAEEHDYDTDCYEDDMETFVEEGTSVLHRALDDNNAIMKALHFALRHYKIMSGSFATGFPLFYWEWHRNATQKDLNNDKMFSYIDLQGHTIQDLSVRPRFKDIKEEVMATGLVSPHQFEQLVVQKAAGLMNSDHCRNIKGKALYGGSWAGKDPLHFGITEGSAVSPHHIQAMVLYCDFTELCTLFSKSVRKNEWEEDLKDVTTRNGHFFHFSKSLRELVGFFGSNGVSGRRYGMNGLVKGPFYSGVSTVLNVSEFNIGFNTPTSTTKTKEIAWRFAGEDGMVIAVGNQKGDSKYQPLFNATWISAFVEEDEYFWFGSTDKLSVEDIVIVRTSRAYRRSINVLYLLDAVLSGENVRGMKVEESEIKILEQCLEFMRNGAVESSSGNIDDFVLDNFYAFCQKKTKIFLYPYFVKELDASFLKFVFYGLSANYAVPDDNCNLFHSELLSLFPNVVELELWTTGWKCYRFNPLSLLSVLKESNIPGSFSRLRIKDKGQKWLKAAFAAIPDIEEQFAAEHFIIEQETTKDQNGDTSDWINLIRKM